MIQKERPTPVSSVKALEYLACRRLSFFPLRLSSTSQRYRGGMLHEPNKISVRFAITLSVLVFVHSCTLMHYWIKARPMIRELKKTEGSSRMRSE